ncbi:MAG: transglycosylase family protein [Solirubrobacteraceae bacterium]
MPAALMPFASRLSGRTRGAVILLLLVLAAGGVVHRASAADPGALRRDIQRQKQVERRLSGSIDRIGVLEARTVKAVAVLSRRLAAAQADAARWQARLAQTQAQLRATRERLVRLRRRLAQARKVLADTLLRRYTTDPPDVVSVVLDAKGFTQVLERLDFLRRVRNSDTEIVGAVRRGRADAHRDEVALARLEPEQRARTQAVQRERDALASVGAALAQRRAALARIRAIRVAALQSSRASRRSAQRRLSSLLAAQARAARQAGPGGPWAIPWPIVQCESGGQNLPPNSATASGYYQMLDSTWKGLGGSTPHAYQASKAEQDRLAGRLWAGGAGAHNWVCAALVGT